MVESIKNTCNNLRNEIQFKSETFEDIKIKNFLNIEHRKRIRFHRRVRRMGLDLLWGETPMARLWASSFDIAGK
ncbi:unnamed protein product [Lasius platythorax]|uniref:Uncharacterized protein n=1 Tax=Lasius platythorax TaxID=488582 RepID=A0AAV2NY28_9HYME